MTENQIQRALTSKFLKGALYVVANIYFFARSWESDFLVVGRNNYITEFEIKTSRKDFRADFKKKRKHEILETGMTTKKRWVGKGKGKDGSAYTHYQSPADRPNRFYYVCPPGIIGVEDLPKYAGLIHIGPRGSYKRVKIAPILHKKLVDFKPKFLQKFYWEYLRAKLL